MALDNSFIALQFFSNYHLPSEYSRLELIWGIRHVVVHRAGITTPDFVKRHPGVVTRVGDRIQPKSFDFKAFLESVMGFMEPTEQFFLKRYPSLAVAAAKGPAGA